MGQEERRREKLYQDQRDWRWSLEEEGLYRITIQRWQSSVKQDLIIRGEEEWCWWGRQPWWWQYRDDANLTEASSAYRASKYIYSLCTENRIRCTGICTSDRSTRFSIRLSVESVWRKVQLLSYLNRDTPQVSNFTPSSSLISPLSRRLIASPSSASPVQLYHHRHEPFSQWACRLHRLKIRYAS